MQKIRKKSIIETLFELLYFKFRLTGGIQSDLFVENVAVKRLIISSCKQRFKWIFCNSFLKLINLALNDFASDSPPPIQMSGPLFSHHFLSALGIIYRERGTLISLEPHCIPLPLCPSSAGTNH